MAAAPSASKPVLIAFGILAGLNALNGALAGTDMVPKVVAAWIAIGTGVLAAILAVVVQGVVVPLNAVGARLTRDGKMVSGPADQTIANGAEVELTPTTDTGAGLNDVQLPDMPG